MDFLLFSGDSLELELEAAGVFGSVGAEAWAMRKSDTRMLEVISWERRTFWRKRVGFEVVGLL